MPCTAVWKSLLAKRKRYKAHNHASTPNAMLPQSVGDSHPRLLTCDIAASSSLSCTVSPSLLHIPKIHHFLEWHSHERRRRQDPRSLSRTHTDHQWGRWPRPSLQAAEALSKCTCVLPGNHSPSIISEVRAQVIFRALPPKRTERPKSEGNHQSQDWILSVRSQSNKTQSSYFNTKTRWTERWCDIQEGHFGCTHTLAHTREVLWRHPWWKLFRIECWAVGR